MELLPKTESMATSQRIAQPLSNVHKEAPSPALNVKDTKGTKPRQSSSLYESLFVYSRRKKQRIGQNEICIEFKVGYVLGGVELQLKLSPT